MLKLSWLQTRMLRRTGMRAAKTVNHGLSGKRGPGRWLRNVVRTVDMLILRSQQNLLDKFIDTWTRFYSILCIYRARIITIKPQDNYSKIAISFSHNILLLRCDTWFSSLRSLLPHRIDQNTHLLFKSIQVMRLEKIDYISSSQFLSDTKLRCKYLKFPFKPYQAFFRISIPLTPRFIWRHSSVVAYWNKEALLN